MQQDSNALLNGYECNDNTIRAAKIARCIIVNVRGSDVGSENLNILQFLVASITENATCRIINFSSIRYMHNLR